MVNNKYPPKNTSNKYKMNRRAQEPFIITGQILTTLYFTFFILNPILLKAWDEII